MPVDLRDLPIALLTLSGHKLGAPKGIGALVVRDRGWWNRSFTAAGSSTASVPAPRTWLAPWPGLRRPAGRGRAGGRAARLAALRDQLEIMLLRDVADLMVVGGERHARAAYPHRRHRRGRQRNLLMHLDMHGIAASGGSACSTGAVEPSHVLCAMGVPRDMALGQLRFSFGHESTTADVERAAAVLPGSWPGPASSRGPSAVPERRAGAGRHVGRGGLVGRGRAPGGAGLRRGGRHHEALLLRRVGSRPPVLLARLDQRRARRGPRTRHSALRAEPRGPVLPPRHPELRERVQPRPDADPVRALQLVHQVPRPARACRWLQCDSIATDIMPWPAMAALYRGLDRSKDQSYFLWGIDQAVVARMLTPVGELSKAETRAYARASGSRRPTSRSPSRSASCPTTTTSACSSSTCPPMPPPSPVGRSSPPAGEVVGEHDGFARVHDRPAQAPAGRLQRGPLCGGDPSRAREVVIGSLEDLEGHRVTLEEVNWLWPAARAGRRLPGAAPLPGAGGPGTVIESGAGTVGPRAGNSRARHHARPVRRPLRHHRAGPRRRRHRLAPPEPEPLMKASSSASWSMHWPSSPR